MNVDLDPIKSLYFLSGSKSYEPMANLLSSDGHISSHFQTVRLKL